MYGTRGEHQSWIDRATHNSPQRVPCSLVEPVQKVIESMLDHISCCTVIEPVEFNSSMDHLHIHIIWMQHSRHASPVSVTVLKPYRHYTHHGSNSCMMLSNRMTANKRAEKPDTHAKKRMANVMRLFHPAELVNNDFILTSVSAGL